MRIGLVVAAVVLSSLGCGTEPPLASQQKQLSYAVDVEPLIVKRCLGCHEVEEPKAELVLEVGTGFSQMVGRESTQVPGQMIVEPGSSADSYLWLKLIHEQTVGKGMPKTLFGAKQLPQQELELIRMWID
ncbi:MAG: hypothetical protein GY906_21060, partial [bacterium]|nr:hypothetical protein [bacterium]